jgi:hypothetical protein
LPARASPSAPARFRAGTARSSCASKRPSRLRLIVVNFETGEKKIIITARSLCATASSAA